MKPTHDHPVLGLEKLLQTGILLSLLIFILELFGGLWSHSLALISDAWHIFIDIWALVISYLAIYLAKRPANESRTYGLHRMEVLAACVNGITVFLIAAGILHAAIRRLNHPPQVQGQWVTGMAAIGLILNLVVARMFYSESEHDLNIRGAYLHLLGDAVGTLAVLASGLIILFTGWRQIDPIVSILIALMVLWGAGRLLRESLNTLLEGVPRGVKLVDVEQEMKTVAGVESVHDLHVWSICSHLKALSGHVMLAQGSMPQQETVLASINRQLKQRFGISHTTIQVESQAWPNIEQAQG
jgi:cobalt-zinc-cadmium efflux system protein